MGIGLLHPGQVYGFTARSVGTSLTRNGPAEVILLDT